MNFQESIASVSSNRPFNLTLRTNSSRMRMRSSAPVRIWAQIFTASIWDSLLSGKKGYCQSPTLIKIKIKIKIKINLNPNTYPQTRSCHIRLLFPQMSFPWTKPSTSIFPMLYVMHSFLLFRNIIYSFYWNEKSFFSFLIKKVMYLCNSKF